MKNNCAKFIRNIETNSNHMMSLRSKLKMPINQAGRDRFPIKIGKNGISPSIKDIGKNLKELTAVIIKA